MDVDANECEHDEYAVDIEEAFVEGVAQWRPRLYRDNDKRNSADGAPLEGCAAKEQGIEVVHTISSDGIGRPCGHMDDGLDDENSGDPAMEKIECVVADVEDRDERVIA